jgi:hypothetical protein
VASSPQTQITLSPPVAQVPTLGPGEHFTFSTAEDFLLEATAPVTLVQFMSGSQTVQTHPNDGDPSMLLAVPVRQFRQRYIFLVPNTYSRDWVSVVHPRGATVMLNGAPLDLGQAQPVAGTQYMVSRLSVEDGRHEVVADMPVGVSVYGFDHNISYAYPAGLDLERPQ